MKPKRLLPLTALAFTCSLHAQNGTWNVDADGNWNDDTNWLGSIIADGSGSSALFTRDITGNRTITLGADRTIGNITFTDTTSSNDLTISGANLLTLAGTTPTVTVTQSGRTLTIGSEIAGTSGLLKSGLGNLTLNGSTANSFTGGLNVSAGTLTLNYGALPTPTNLVNSANALSLGGTLTITGKNSATNTFQTFAGTTLNAGLNTINITKGASATSANLTLNALTINQGSVTIINPGTTWATGTTLPAAEIIKVTSIPGKSLPGSAGSGNWIPVNAGLFYSNTSTRAAGSARWVQVDNLGQLTQIASAPASQPTSGATALSTQISSADITLLGNASSFGFVVNSNSATRTLNLGAGGFTYTINGILGVNTNKAIINPGTGGTIVIGSERNLVINMDNTGGVDVNAPIVDNGGGASAVTIASTAPGGTTPGTVTLAGNNGYTGHTYINNTNVTLGNNNALGTAASGTTLIGAPIGNTAGTTLNLGSTTLTLSEPINMNASALGRVRLYNDSAAEHVLNGSIDVTSETSAPQIWSNNTGSMTINGDITGTMTGTSFFLRGTSTNTNNRVLGSLNITGNLAKTDAGTWTIGGSGGTYSWGTTLISVGTVRMGQANALPSSTVVSLGQSGSNPATLDLNGFSQTVAGIQLSAVAGTGTRTITSATGATLTVGDANSYNYGGVITGEVALNKAGSGALTLANTNTYNGATTVSAGTLYVTGALSNSAVTVEANGAVGRNGGTDGTLGKGLTILAGGNLDLTGATLNPDAPGTGILSLTGGSLTLGNLTFQDLIGWNWLDAAPGTYELIGGTFTVDFGSTAYLSEATAYDFGNGKTGYFTAGSLNAVIIPEPSAVLLAGLGALALLRRRR